MLCDPSEESRPPPFIPLPSFGVRVHVGRALPMLLARCRRWNGALRELRKVVEEHDAYAEEVSPLIWAP